MSEGKRLAYLLWAVGKAMPGGLYIRIHAEDGPRAMALGFRVEVDEEGSTWIAGPEPRNYPLADMLTRLIAQAASIGIGHHGVLRIGKPPRTATSLPEWAWEYAAAWSVLDSFWDDIDPKAEYGRLALDVITALQDKLARSALRIRVLSEVDNC